MQILRYYKDLVKTNSYQAPSVQFKTDLINVQPHPGERIQSIFIAEFIPIPKKTDIFHFIW